MKYIKIILYVWGALCLVFAVFDILITLNAAFSVPPHLELDFTRLLQWMNMGLISLGLARVIELLEKK